MNRESVELTVQLFQTLVLIVLFQIVWVRHVFEPYRLSLSSMVATLIPEYFLIMIHTKRKRTDESNSYR